MIISLINLFHGDKLENHYKFNDEKNSEIY
jgi:hypothetical protein